MDRDRAVELNDHGRRFLDAGDLEAAAQTFERAVDADPHLDSAWFNLGLVHKFRRNWSEALRCNREAARLSPPDEAAAAWWNLGIAATALGEWPAAREAWVNYGIDIGWGEGPLEMDLGLTPIRIRSDEDAEVVWCRRIDPARAVILNVPFPSSGHRWGDYVLHDGVPNGERRWDGRTYAVFDELARWHPSPTPTLVAEVGCEDESDSRALSDVFESAGRAAEDWSMKVRMLCAACSEGRAHETHEEHGDATGWDTTRRFGLAAEMELARDLLDRWREQDRSSRMVDSLEVGL